MRDGSKLSRSNGTDWYRISDREISGRRRAANGRKSCKGTHHARVWSINHVVPGDRWTLGSMETPHNWENSAGLLVDRAHGHLSCRDRAPIDGFGPIRVNAREIACRPFGKISLVRSLEAAHKALAPAWSIPRRRFSILQLRPLLPMYLVIGNKYRYHWTHAPARVDIHSKYLYTE